MKKVIELIRVSTSQQAGDDRFSIPAQRSINRKTAAANDLSISKSIEISDVGGSDVLAAPEIQELLKLIQAPDIHGVVAREFSRLMRPENLGDFSLLQAFADSKTLLYLPDGPIDFAAKTGRLLGTIRAAIAGLEKSEFLERSLGAREEMRRQGKCPSSPSTWPTAVAYDKTRGWYYLPEITNVRKCFELFLSGVSNYNELERETGLTRWNVRGILTNPIYTGWRVYDRKRDPDREGRYTSIDGRQSGRRKMCRAPEDIIRVKVIDDPIVSEAEFARAQEMLKAKRDRHIRARHSSDSRFVYHGFLACAECGEVEYTRTYTSRKSGLVSDYYVCSARQSWLSNRPNPVAVDERCLTPYMRRERLEQHLDQLFAVRLTDRGFLRELVEELEAGARGRGSKTKVLRLEDQIRKLDDKRQRILDGYFEGVISRGDRDARVEAVVRDRALALKSLSEEVPHREIDAEMLVELFRPLFTWRMLQAEAKRRILFSLVPEIKVSNYLVAGMSLLVPSLCGTETATRKPSVPGDRGLFLPRESFGSYASHHTMAPLIADPSSRVWIPLNH